ncbi:hypothetical protein T484DRAFT_1789715 [Baffinella frigidus]|nr:hypothetical protein T484DRAFT_1789715 [Cryptophyta sp. CCMP2293]
MRSLVVLLVSLFVLAGRPACAADATELALETPVSGSVSKGGAPLLYCYTAPAFNVWRTFNEVNIEVAAPEGYIPNVHSASRDDLHGLVDGYVRGKTETWQKP